MSYGIEILNDNSRILIDENYPNYGFLSTTATTLNLSASGRISYPGISGATSSDLIFARTGTNDNGFISESWDSSYNPAWYERQNNNNDFPTQFNEPSSVVAYVIRDMSSIYSPSTSGYGLEVYKANGGVVFTSNITKYFTIIATGVFNSLSSSTNYIDFPSSTGTYSDLSKYYCLMNPTFSVEIPIFNILNFAGRGYQYIWTGSNVGRIRLWSIGFQDSAPNNGIYPTLNNVDIDLGYMIIKEIG